MLVEGCLTSEGLGAWARERYECQDVKAGACIDCGVCETRGPYQLPVREMMAKAAEVFGE